MLLEQQSFSPLFIQGDAEDVLQALPADLVDFCMTSPPYWGKREYENGGIGLEHTIEEYIDNLLSIFSEVWRVLKPTGSFWLNIGDTYLNIELSTHLTEDEKRAAMYDLEQMLNRVRSSEVADFRMIIRGQQRTTHSDSERVSGRAKELRDKGYYFLMYDPKGSKPGDVWDILPEDTQKRNGHFAPYPEDLCRIPILATCPPTGIVLDPFCGTGTTNFVAQTLARKSIGIDISDEYLAIATERCWRLI